jgi:hypothetical protein
MAAPWREHVVAVGYLNDGRYGATPAGKSTGNRDVVEFRFNF